MTDWHPQPLAGDGDVVELDWLRLGDQAVLVAYDRNGTRTLLSTLGFDRSAINAAIQRLVQNAAIVSTTLLTEYDNYYYLYHNRDASDKPLPVIRAELADDGNTYVYVDPVDGRLMARLDRSRRVYRWLFSGIHRWDLPGLYLRPLWDVWQLTWIALGLGMSLTSVVLAWRWLRRKYVILRYRSAGIELEEAASTGGQSV